MSIWEEKISLQDLDFKKVKPYVFAVEDDEGRPVICIDDEGHGYCLTRKNLKTLLTILDKDYPKKRKGNTAYGMADLAAEVSRQPFVPDESKRKVCYPECGCLNC